MRQLIPDKINLNHVHLRCSAEISHTTKQSYIRTAVSHYNRICDVYKSNHRVSIEVTSKLKCFKYNITEEICIILTTLITNYLTQTVHVSTKYTA